MIRVLDVPGVPQLEAFLELVPGQSASGNLDVRRKIEGIAQFLGCGLDDWCRIDVPVPPDAPAVDFEFEDYEETFLVEIWKDLGWDVAGRDGALLRSYAELQPALISIEKGWGPISKVELEAAIWKHKKESNRAPDPREVKQNRAFLDLGAKRRAKAA